MSYIDGYLLAVPSDKRDEYRAAFQGMGRHTPCRMLGR
jgi:uncharacterized protein YbaA (DUF1428 family)